MSRTLLVSFVSLALVAGCAWPPSLPSGPAAPSPVDAAANQATGVVDQTAGVVGQTTGAVAQSVPRLQAPAMSAPRLSGSGGLLRR